MPKIVAAWNRESWGVLAIAALALLATTSVLALGLARVKLPDETPELRRATLVTALSLSVLRDPANSALGD